MEHDIPGTYQIWRRLAKNKHDEMIEVFCSQREVWVFFRELANEERSYGMCIENTQGGFSLYIGPDVESGSVAQYWFEPVFGPNFRLEPDIEDSIAVARATARAEVRTRRDAGRSYQ